MNITIIAIAVMILLLIGMLVIKKTMANSPMMQPVLFLCVALELALVIFVFYNQLSGGGGDNSAIGRAIRREEVKASIVGAYLKEKMGGKKTVILCSSGTKESKIGGAFLGAFKKSYGEATEVELKPNNDESGDVGDGIPLKDVEEALKGHEDAELIVFYVGLPKDYKKLNAKAAYFLFEQGAADIKDIKSLITSGKIVGIITGQKNPPKTSDPIEKNDKEAFDKRYILVDKGNLNSLD